MTAIQPDRDAHDECIPAVSIEWILSRFPVGRGTIMRNLKAGTLHSYRCGTRRLIVEQDFSGGKAARAGAGQQATGARHVQRRGAGGAVPYSCSSQAGL